MAENPDDYGDSAIVQPIMIPGEPEPPTAVIGFSQNEVSALLAALGAPRPEPQKLVGASMRYRVDDVVVVGPAIGAPHAVMTLEVLLAHGVERVFCLGSCGSIQKDLTIGDIVMPDSALSDEGTSAHYLHPEALPIASGAIMRSLEAQLRERKLAYRRGPVWTTDAPFRETVDAVTKHRASGLLAVEMEMSAMFTVGLYREADVGALLYVTDELWSLTWNEGFRSDEVADARVKAAEIVVAAL